MSKDPENVIVSSVVSDIDYRPYVQFEIKGHKFQLTPKEARDFAESVLVCSIHSLMDAALVEFVRSRLGVNEKVNVAAILMDWRKATQYIDSIA